MRQMLEDCICFYLRFYARYLINSLFQYFYAIVKRLAVARLFTAHRPKGELDASAFITLYLLCIIGRDCITYIRFILPIIVNRLKTASAFIYASFLIL